MQDRALLRDLVSAPLVSGFAAGKDDQTDSSGDGVPQLRPTNILPDGEISFDGAKYIPRARVEDSDVLADGEVLFNNTNSTAWVGKSALFREGDHPAVVCSNHVTRIRPNKRVNGAFLVEVLNLMQRSGYFGRLATNFNNQAGINGDTLGDVEIPLGPAERRPKLLAALDAARAARRRKLEEAESLLGGLDAFVLEALGLTLPPPHDPNKPFAVRLRQVRDRRLDPPAYTPFPIPTNPRRVPIKPLSSVADIDNHEAPAQTDENAIVPYVGLPECDLNDVREVASRTYREARGRSVAHVGDILFARIEPSVFNKKYVFVEHLGDHDYAFLSTEFYAVRAHGNDDDQKYLYAMFQSAFVFNQVRGKTTGSSGRRRLDPDMFASLLIPWPDGAVRKKIAAEVSRRRDAARRLREDAAHLWDDAKRRFEEELLGPAAPATKGGR